jgi:acetoin utilization deacetylase AcuC-like enzyme
VAILDFDVHHGNGTQAIFENEPEVLYVSSHQVPLYPGTGYAEETGCGNILNLPLAPGSGSAEFRTAWFRRGLPALERFAPDLVIVSAGFDAHQRDPLAQLELQDADYAWITAEIRALADAACGGRLVSVLEGGYDLDALASASSAHVQALIA